MWHRLGFSGWTLATLVIAALVALPVLAVVSRVFVPTGGVWQHLVETVLAEYVLNTVRLVFGVGLGTLVIGQLGKILPFLVWLHRFEPLAGLKKIPLASDLLPEKAQRLSFWAIHAGVPVLALGVAVDLAAVRVAGAGVFAAGVVLAARNLAVVCRSQP